MWKSEGRLEPALMRASMHSAYCPHCRAVTNLRESITPEIVTGPDGKEKIVFSKVYHCAVCGLFVKNYDDISATINLSG